MEVSGKREWDRQPSSTAEGQIVIVCQPCQCDGETVQAEGFCETCNEFICTHCLNVHRKLAVSKNHVIKLKDEMPRVNVKTDSCSELCKIHKAEIVKFYCQDHDIVGCGDCMVLNHKTCTVKLVSDVSDNYDSGKELGQIKQKIDFLKSELSSNRNVIESDLKAAEKIGIDIVDEIKTFRKEINRYLDNAEADILREIDELKTKDLAKLHQVQKEIKHMETEMKECQSKIRQTADKINQLFVTAKLAEENLKEYKKATEQLVSECEVISHKFVPSKALQTILENNSPIGKITVQRRKFRTQSNKRFIDMKTSFLKTLTVRAENEGKCYISGMAMISADAILLADHQNFSLKILNVDKNEITSTYKTSGLPWNVTVINAGMCAVTLRSGKILFINTSNGISESHSIRVKKDCRGIDYRNGVIAVSFAFPASFQILDMKGTVLHEVAGTNIFKYPDYIALSSDNKCLYVSDYSKNAVYEVTVDGHLKATMTYEGMRTPQGLAMTNDGTIIVCCRGNSDIVSMIVPDTRQILPLTVNGVKSPISIALSEDQNKMYINGDSSGNIKLFDLK